jgi:hypothetical protein
MKYRPISKWHWDRIYATLFWIVVSIYATRLIFPWHL